ncbi:MAG: MarR family transcriptional regulator [Armatimonadetes bacterium]|nr:MarR family transcriptional regulator [Armatimonadota bacterium]
MPFVKDRIYDYLALHPEGADDDELAIALNLSSRQQANRCCRQLEQQGKVKRDQINFVKIRNFAIVEPMAVDDGCYIATDTPESTFISRWDWEGNIQSAVVSFLQEKGFLLIRQANTQTKEKGKDIEAAFEETQLWVTAKGWPQPTPNTPSSTQAGHWFKDAFFDIICYRGENSKAQLGIALPDYSRYRKLSQKVAWLQPIISFTFFWVKEDGTVTIE